MMIGEATTLITLAISLSLDSSAVVLELSDWFHKSDALEWRSWVEVKFTSMFTFLSVRISVKTTLSRSNSYRNKILIHCESLLHGNHITTGINLQVTTIVIYLYCYLTKATEMTLRQIVLFGRWIEQSLHRYISKPVLLDIHLRWPIFIIRNFGKHKYLNTFVVRFVILPKTLLRPFAIGLVSFISKNSTWVFKNNKALSFWRIYYMKP